MWATSLRPEDWYTGSQYESGLGIQGSLVIGNVGLLCTNIIRIRLQSMISQYEILSRIQSQMLK